MVSNIRYGIRIGILMELVGRKGKTGKFLVKDVMD